MFIILYEITYSFHSVSLALLNKDVIECTIIMFVNTDISMLLLLGVLMSLSGCMTLLKSRLTLTKRIQFDAEN